MPVPLMIGSLFVTCALVCYTISIWKTVKTGTVTSKRCILQLVGLCLDISGTMCMAIYNGSLMPADWHGWVGYTAICFMAVDVIIMFRHKATGKSPNPARVYAALCWFYWLFAYFVGAAGGMGML